MWALRRASVPLRNSGYVIVTYQACFAELEKSSKSAADETILFPSCRMTHDKILSTRKFFYNYYYDKYSVGRRELSYQADAETKGAEDHYADGFSETEIRSARGLEEYDANEADLVSAAEVSDYNLDVEESHENELELSETEIEASEKKKSGESCLSAALFKAIVEAPGLSIHTALDKWVEEGNDISRSEIILVTHLLRQRRMYGRALQLSEWVEAKQQIGFVEMDYASRVDLVAKSRGLEKAEKYIENIPESFKGELIYETLLANCVVRDNMKKTEEVFNKMKDLKFPITAFSCNQMLLLYKRRCREKIPDVLLWMENKNVKTTSFTYKILIDLKGQSKDISGMESIVDSMRQEGMEPDGQILAALAKYYAAAGLKEKAEALLKEIERDDVKENHGARLALLRLNAELGNAAEVERIWKDCETSPRFDECVAAIEAWGKLKKIEEAEAVFAKMSKISKKISSYQYSVLLNVYAENKMLAKGKDLFKRMADSGCQICPFTWDALIRLYVDAGEIGKADSILGKAAQLSRKNKMNLRFSSYMVILEQYAKKGDIHDAERIFLRIRKAGYYDRIRQYGALIKAYINAKVPAYGMRERMKADNVVPNKFLSGLLLQVDPFKKTVVSDLLD